MKKQIRPMFSTTVDPSEYDIDEQMERMVKQSNKNRECFTEMELAFRSAQLGKRLTQRLSKVISDRWIALSELAELLGITTFG